MRFALLLVALPCGAGAQKLDAEAAARVGRSAYSLSINARSGHLKDRDFARACSLLPECAADCKATLDWLAGPNDKDLDLALFGGKPAPPPPSRPARLCQDAAGSEAMLVKWARLRFLALAETAVAAAPPKVADRARCGVDRLQGRPSAEACRRAEPLWVAEMVRLLSTVDRSLVEMLAFKGCEELDGCSGACRREMLELAFVLPRRIPAHRGCQRLEQRKGETPEAWQKRVHVEGVVWLVAYFAAMRAELDAAERAAFDCDLAKAGFTQSPIGRTCP